MHGMTRARRELYVMCQQPHTQTEREHTEQSRGQELAYRSKDHTAGSGGNHISEKWSMAMSRSLLEKGVILKFTTYQRNDKND